MAEFQAIGGHAKRLLEAFDPSVLEEVEEEEPCKCSGEPGFPPWQDEKWFCDGEGVLFAKDNSGVAAERCPYWLKWRKGNLDDFYLGSLPEAEATEVKAANRNRGALAKAIEIWNFKTSAVLLAGGVGTGKTIAGHKIVQEYISRLGLPGFYCPSNRTAQAFKARAMGEEEEQAKAAGWLIRAMRRCSEDGAIVFMDDLGRERGTEASIQEVADQIRALYDRRAVAVFATNLTPAGLAERYGADIADRLRTRSWVRAVNCGEESLRK